MALSNSRRSPRPSAASPRPKWVQARLGSSVAAWPKSWAAWGKLEWRSAAAPARRAAIAVVPPLPAAGGDRLCGAPQAPGVSVVLALLQEMGRDLLQEARRLGRHVLSEQAALPGPRQDETLPGARHADVEQAALL